MKRDRVGVAQSGEEVAPRRYHCGLPVPRGGFIKERESNLLHVHIERRQGKMVLN